MLILVAAALLGGMLQTPPASPVDYDPPAQASVSSQYQCPGRRVDFTYDVRAWTSGQPGRVRITRWRSDGRNLPAGRLAQWNAELERVNGFRYVQVECQTGDRAAVTVVGGDRAGRETRVLAFIDHENLTFSASR